MVFGVIYVQFSTFLFSRKFWFSDRSFFGGSFFHSFCWLSVRIFHSAPRSKSNPRTLTTDSDSAPQETPLNICRLAICHCEFNRGQWPQVTLVDLETYLAECQGSCSRRLASATLATSRKTRVCRRAVYCSRQYVPTRPTRSDTLTRWHADTVSAKNTTVLPKRKRRRKRT